MTSLGFERSGIVLSTYNNGEDIILSYSFIFIS